MAYLVITPAMNYPSTYQFVIYVQRCVETISLSWDWAQRNFLLYWQGLVTDLLQCYRVYKIDAEALFSLC